MSNTAASLPGIVGNTATGQLLASTRGDWALVFRLCAGSLVLGALAFLGSEARDQLLDDSPRGSSAGSDLISLGASLAALQELEAGYYLRLGEPSPRQPVSRLVRRIGRLRIGRIRRSFISYAKERRTEYLRGESVR